MMNKQLAYLLNFGDVVGKRTLKFVVDGEITAYTTEYKVNTKLGPFTWYLTWRAETCDDPKKLIWASITKYEVRARTYFPAYLDTRIPPANRESEQLKQILSMYGLREYDKFELIAKTHGRSPIKAGLVYEVEPRDCEYDNIHEIEEIVEEYNAELR